MSPSRKRILIIYTGGTIGMMKTRHGYAPQKEKFHQLLDAIPELKAEGMPDWEVVDMDPLLDSSNITVREWNTIGTMIAGNYDRFDGFVILHGTDTMAYTASALSFTLRNNSKPVILTGSQIPLCEIRNDARDNLITAMQVAADDRVHEVCLYFGGKLLRGNRSIKYSADDLIAFESPNFQPLAEVGIEIRYNFPALLPACKETFSLQTLKSKGAAERFECPKSMLELHAAGKFGIWRNETGKLYTPYVMPQENGSHLDTRHVRFFDGTGRGLRISGSKPFCFGVSRYETMDITEAKHQTDLVPQDYYVLSLDIAQDGIGTGSCGPAPLPQYRLNPGAFDFTWTLAAKA